MAPTVTSAEHHMDMLQKYITYHCWVTEAKQKGRFFRITASGNFTKLRKELKKRGFIEQKPLPSESVFFTMPNSILLEEAAQGNDYEQALVARMVGRRLPDFIWATRIPSAKIVNRTALLNKICIKGENFTIKNGMIKYIEHINNTEANASVINFPRSYYLSNKDTINRFKEDFRLTAAIGLVQFLHAQPNINDWFTPDGDADDENNKNTTVKIYGLDYAIHVIFIHIKYADGSLTKDHYTKCRKLTEAQWKVVLEAHVAIVKHKKKIYACNEIRDDYVLRIKMVGPDIPLYLWNRNHDGLHNV